MEGLFDSLFLSRVQFALATSFHILWPTFSIGLGVFLVILEGLWIKTGDSDYYHHARFWSKIFLLTFAVGVVSGIPLAFQFGTNWSGFAAVSGGFFGHLLTFEALVAFMLEAAFLGVMIFGWNRVSPRMHFFSTLMVTLGASISAFWIMAANAWMQTPAGVAFKDGAFVVEDYWAAIFNPDWFLGSAHMWLATVETVIFFIGGVSAWKMLTGRQILFFRKTFMLAFFLAIVAAPVQFILGDESGRLMAHHQPAKLAALESHWETNRPGEDAAWYALAWPNEELEKNDFQIKIPYGLSLVISRSLTGEVKGLKEFPRDERPPIVIPFYSFRLMMGIGMFMIFIMVLTYWYWWQRRLLPERIAYQKKPLFLWVLAAPLGFVAVLLGWMTREIGRQPWLVYGLLKTEDAASPLPDGAVGTSLLVFTVVYAFLLLLFIGAAGRIIRRGADLKLPVPERR
jgi:cytochrome d ubiquinol oxidase subunit I